MRINHYTADKSCGGMVRSACESARTDSPCPRLQGRLLSGTDKGVEIWISNKFIFNFYWSTVDLQCCVSFRYTIKVNKLYLYIYPLFFRFFWADAPFQHFSRKSINVIIVCDSLNVCIPPKLIFLKPNSNVMILGNEASGKWVGLEG